MSPQNDRLGYKCYYCGGTEGQEMTYDGQSIKSALDVDITPSGGTKFDQGKTRIDLFPPEALFAISDILTSGALKYEERNWEKGMKWSRVFGAGMRHAWAWWGAKITGGDTTTNHSFLFGDLDDDTNRSHLWHLGCCVVFLITYEMRGTGEDDRPT